MRVLGINSNFGLLHDDAAFGHDASAVLVENGAIVAAAAEERFTRVKHTGAFPVEAIRHCLAQARADLDSIDLIAVHGTERGRDAEVYYHVLHDGGLQWQGAAAYIDRLFEERFGVGVRARLTWCDHHVAHAWSAYGCSGLSASLVVTLDGAGDSRSGTAFVASDGRLEPIADYSVPESIGMTYWFITMVLGFRRFDEYKVMGLAPWGDPQRFGGLFRSMYTLLDDGRYRFEDRRTINQGLLAAGVFQLARGCGDRMIGDRADIAAALQQTTEEIGMHVIGHYRTLTGQQNLCLAGGVAHNCSLVGKILKTGWFRRVFVQPAADDGGGALGAALWAYHQHASNPDRPSLPHVYLGPHIGSDARIHARLAEWAPLVSFSVSGDVAHDAAQLLAQGYVLGWVQGRSEFGPRALGNRSILADPRPASNKDRINAMIKKREAFRPFAPAVPQEAFAEYFDGAGCAAFPFMTVVVDVRADKRALLGAVTHVDGSARVQTVARETNPLFHDLLSTFGRLTGVPILLNTSFNNNAEPIVESIDDAVACFVTSGLDYLAIGNCVAAKPEPRRLLTLLNDLVPAIAPHWQLCRLGGVHPDGGDEFGLETEPGIREHRKRRGVSAHAFRVLQGCDARRTLAELNGAPLSEQLLSELLELWTARAVLLHPRPSGARAEQRDTEDQRLRLRNQSATVQA